MGASALKLREGRGFRNECGDWRASGARAKLFWEVCPKQGKSKAEEPSLRKWGLIGTRWMGDPSLLAGRETEPIPNSARPSRPGQKGVRAARCKLRAEMSRWLPLEGGGEGGGCAGPALSFSFSSFKLHASSQRCHIPPFCTEETQNKPGVGFYPLQSPRQVALGPCCGWAVDAGLCPQIANASLPTPATTHHRTEGACCHPG